MVGLEKEEEEDVRCRFLMDGFDKDKVADSTNSR